MFKWPFLIPHVFCSKSTSTEMETYRQTVKKRTEINTLFTKMMWQLKVKQANDSLSCSYQQIQRKDRNQQHNSSSWQVFVSEARCILSLCAVELYCCSKTIKNIAVSHTVAPADTSLHYTEDGNCRLFWVNPINTILLQERLTITKCINPRLKLNALITMFHLHTNNCLEVIFRSLFYIFDPFLLRFTQVTFQRF